MSNPIRSHGLTQHPFGREGLPSSVTSVLSSSPRTHVRSEAQCEFLRPGLRLPDSWKPFLQPATDRKDTMNIALAYQKREIDRSFIPGHAPGEPLWRHSLWIEWRRQRISFLFLRGEKTKVVEAIGNLSLRPLLRSASRADFDQQFFCEIFQIWGAVEEEEHAEMLQDSETTPPTLSVASPFEDREHTVPLLSDQFCPEVGLC